MSNCLPYGTDSRLSILICVILVLTSGWATAQSAPVVKPIEEDADQNKALRPPIGLTGIELDELESDFEPKIDRFVLPPYYQETRGNVQLRLLFPLFFLRERTGKGARTDMGILPFYWRHREGKSATDVYFPFYWRFRDPAFDTDIVLQTYYNRSSHGYNLGSAPFFFFGKDTRDGSNYQVVPPLFWRFVEGESSFTLAGLYYSKRDAEDYHLGLPPLFFAGRKRYETYLTVLPPLFWRFTDEITYRSTTIVPPFFLKTRETGYSVGLLPFLYFARNRTWDRTLVAPFFYASRWQHKNQFGDHAGEGRSYYLPLLLSYYRHAQGLTQGGAAVFYHWYESEGAYLRMISPLLWLWGNRRTDDDSVFVPPLFYRRTSPVRTDTMAGLVLWNFHEHHKERTFAIAPLFAHNWNLYEKNWRTWVFPTFDFGQQTDGYHFRIHPLFYRGKWTDRSHLVVAPFFWKFRDEKKDDFVLFPFWWRFRDLEHGDTANVIFPFWWRFTDPGKKKVSNVGFPLFWDFTKGRTQERTTVAFPLFWRDRDPTSTMSGFLNFVWHKGQIKGNRFWTFQMFPFVGFGHPPAPEGAYWSVLGGLAGWRRQGRTKELRILWIPFDLSD